MPPDNAITDIQVTSPLAMTQTGSSVALWVEDIEPIWVKRTAQVDGVVDAGGTARTAYRWRKQQMGPGGVWKDSEDGVSGFPSGLSNPQQPLFSATPTHYIPLADVVRIYPGVRDTNPDPDANHGLEWWFAGGPLDRVMLRTDTLADPGPTDIHSVYGVRARLQRWKVTTPYSPSTYPDNSKWEDVPGPVYVRVRDPNADVGGTGANFAPGEYFWGSFVETLPQTGEDLYSRSGLDGLQVGNNTGPYDDNPSFPGGFLHGVRTIAFGESFYVTSTAEMGATINGTIASLNVSGRIENNTTQPYQWLRGGFSGLSSLGVNEIYFSPGGAPLSAPMTSGDFANWAGSDGATSGHPSTRMGGGVGSWFIEVVPGVLRVGFSSDSLGGRGGFFIGGSSTANHFDSISFFAGNYTFAADPTLGGSFTISSPQFLAPGFHGGGGTGPWGNYETWMGSGSSANVAGFQITTNPTLREAQIYGTGGIRMIDNVTTEHDVHIKGNLTVDGGTFATISVDGGTW